MLRTPEARDRAKRIAKAVVVLILLIALVDALAHGCSGGSGTNDTANGLVTTPGP